MRKLIIITIIIFPFLYGKVLLPQENSGGELLEIQFKAREYHLLDNNSYIVSGPSTVFIYARLAVPKNEKGIHSFSIKSFLSDATESIHKFNKKVDSSVSSSLHPMHRYTKSAKIEIDVPKGNYTLSVDNKLSFGNPILVRVIQKRNK